jgi:chromosome segregation ATPase
MVNSEKKVASSGSTEVSGRQLPVNQETLDILVANIIPTSKYFEARFDHMEDRVERIQNDLSAFRVEVGKRFDDMKSDVDRRFEQVDKRFEQVDKRFEQIIASIDKLTDKLDHRDERQRNFTLRMFTISITISILGVAGAFLKALGIL